MIAIFVLVIAIFAILVIVIAVASEEDFPDFFVVIDFYFAEKILDVGQENEFDFVSYVYDVGGFDAVNLIYSWSVVWWSPYFLWTAMELSSFSGHPHLKNLD